LVFLLAINPIYKLSCGLNVIVLNYPRYIDLNTASNFFETLKHLRYYEEFILFGKLLPFNEREDSEIIEWLHAEYRAESKGYPHQAPAFDKDAAIWAAKTMYISGQLLLHREHRSAELYAMLPAFKKEVDAGSVLSADITLRFLPDLINQLDNIDADDELIPLLEFHLGIWHYSGIRHSMPKLKPAFDVVLSDQCLRQLYIDRVITYKNLSLAKNPLLKPYIHAVLGIYADEYWREFSKASQ